MKIYKLGLTVEAVEIFPFQFLHDWKDKINLFFSELKLEERFKKLNWSEAEVWDLTYCCGSSNEAANKLCWILTEDRRLTPLAKKLVLDGFERDWE